MIAIGESFARYRIVELIGEGGMGVVYRANDERLERDVALKVLPPGTLSDEAARKRFRQEALALSKLNHPNIATVYDFDSQGGTDFLVMEYIEGTTLDQRLSSGPMPEEQVRQLGTQIAAGLECAHAHGIIHRDLKPGNLRVTSDQRLKILDFGLAKLLRPLNASAATQSLSQTGHAVGTAPYMAPEQLLDETVDARTDVYAAGNVLYEMATGRRPFPEKQSSRLMDAILRQPPIPTRNLNGRISLQLEAVILKCLEKNPEKRYQSARELAVDLRRAAEPAGPTAETPGKARKWYIVAALAAAMAVALVLAWNARKGMNHQNAPGHVSSLAVLPLENFSHDPEQEYFADGMTEELITEMAQIRSLRIISRTSVMQYKGTHKTVPEIARELNVDAIVEGSVMRSGQQVRITAQLVEGPSDRHLWAKSFDRDLQNVLNLQSEVARSIASEIQVSLSPQEEARLTRSRPVNAEAHDNYLKGRYHWNRFTTDGMKAATGYFQQAVAADPKYALAYVGLSDAYHQSTNFGIGPPSELMPKAKAAVLKALELDNDLADAHATLGWIKWHYDWDFAGAEKEFRQALQLDPANAKAPGMYADFLDSLGRFDEALVQHRRALEIDPVWLISNSNFGDSFYFARRYDAAIEGYKRTLAIDNTFAAAHFGLAQTYKQKQMYREALAELEESFTLDGKQEDARRAGQAFAAAGWDGVERVLIEIDQKERAAGYSPPGDIAFHYAALGDKDRSFEWLEKAHAERDESLLYLKVEPGFDPLRSDPRFAELVKRVGLPQ